MADDAQGLAGYSRGNNDSSAFFESMRMLHGETEAIRRQCRAAAGASAARQQEEKVSLDHVRKAVGEAHLASSLARSVAGEGNPSPTSSDVPLYLGHLTLPRACEDELGVASTEFLLPGAVAQEAATADAAGAAQLPLETTIGPGSPGDLGTGTAPRSAPPGTAGSAGARAGPGSLQSTLSQELQPGVERPFEGTGVAHPEENDPHGADSHASSPRASSDISSFGRSSESTEGWAPKAPLLRFKVAVQFSKRFQPWQEANLIKKATEAKEAASAQEQAQAHEKAAFLSQAQNPSLVRPPDVHAEELAKSAIVVWLNKTFELDVRTAQQFDVGFPIIVLTMLDAIYPQRVRWREIDWQMKYQRALHKNYAVLLAIWKEVNMEKVREFRMENLALRLESMATSPLRDKLEFLRLLKRWFDQRIHHSRAYDPMEKRREYVEQCKKWGNKIEFPVWIKYQEGSQQGQESSRHLSIRGLQGVAYEKMPEYKRLIWFLGSHEHQTM